MNDTQIRAALKAAADPTCDTCGGEGVVCIAPQGDPDQEQDVACDCAKHALDGIDEPHDQREAL